MGTTMDINPVYVSAGATLLTFLIFVVDKMLSYQRRTQNDLARIKEELATKLTVSEHAEICRMRDAAMIASLAKIESAIEKQEKSSSESRHTVNNHLQTLFTKVEVATVISSRNEAGIRELHDEIRAIALGTRELAP
jgi:hypothetical protein